MPTGDPRPAFTGIDWGDPNRELSPEWLKPGAVIPSKAIAAMHLFTGSDAIQRALDFAAQLGDSPVEIQRDGSVIVRAQGAGVPDFGKAPPIPSVYCGSCAASSFPRGRTCSTPGCINRVPNASNSRANSPSPTQSYAASGTGAPTPPINLNMRREKGLADVLAAMATAHARAQYGGNRMVSALKTAERMGWRLVPVKITDEMRNAAYEGGGVDEAFARAVNAAPSLP